MAVPLMAVIEWPVFSKLSLRLTSMVIAVSSFVVTVSLAISATAVTEMAIVSVSESAPSEVTRVSWAEPL